MKLNLYNNFLEILHSDTFWVAVAFFIFIAISFKKGKELILQGLDKKIEEIKKNINEAKKIKYEAENNLKEAKKMFKELELDKERIIKEAKKESEIIKQTLFDQEKKNNERLNNQIDDRILQSKNQAIKDIKRIALEVSIKSILELFKEQKNTNESGLIAKSVINLFNKKKKEEKNYKEL